MKYRLILDGTRITGVVTDGFSDADPLGTGPIVETELQPIDLLSRCIYRFKVQGDENIPAQGAAVLTCNHVSFIDAVVLMAFSAAVSLGGAATLLLLSSLGR